MSTCDVLINVICIHNEIISNASKFIYKLILVRIEHTNKLYSRERDRGERGRERGRKRGERI